FEESSFNSRLWFELDENLLTSSVGDYYLVRHGIGNVWIKLRRKLVLAGWNCREAKATVGLGDRSESIGRVGEHDSCSFYWSTLVVPGPTYPGHPLKRLAIYHGLCFPFYPTFQELNIRFV